MDQGRLAMDLLLILVAAAAAVTDVRAGRIPNALTGSAIVAGLVLNALVTPGGHGIGPALLGFAIGFVPLVAVYALGGMGGGDVKLMGAVGAFLGPHDVLFAMLYTFLLGAGMAAVAILWSEGVIGLAFRLREAFGSPRTPEAGPRIRFPFAVAILLGTAWAVIESHLGSSLLDAVRGGAR